MNTKVSKIALKISKRKHCECGDGKSQRMQKAEQTRNKFLSICCSINKINIFFISHCLVTRLNEKNKLLLIYICTVQRTSLYVILFSYNCAYSMFCVYIYKYVVTLKAYRALLFSIIHVLLS